MSSAVVGDTATLRVHFGKVSKRTKTIIIHHDYFPPLGCDALLVPERQ